MLQSLLFLFAVTTLVVATLTTVVFLCGGTLRGGAHFEISLVSRPLFYFLTSRFYP
ncbi:MAG: hypothetical protein HZB11_00805 [Candidatus Yonathbacteria bacterium]|nr:hypothetical protein [Candidatus Yonathbacteria bacterium]